MLHNDHCSFCGASIKNWTCTNERCLRKAHALPAFPWSECDCGDNMLGILNLFQIFEISWLGIFGLFSFIAGIFFLKAGISIFGLWIVLAWYIGRRLISVEFTMERRYNFHKLKQAEMESVLVVEKMTSQQKKDLESESNKVKAYRSYLLGVRIFRSTITMLVVFTMLICYLVSFTNISTYIDSRRENVDKIVAETSNGANKIIESIKKEVNWEKTEMRHLQYILVDKRGMSFEQFNEIKKIVRSKTIKKKEILDMVDDTDKCMDGLYNYLILRIQKIVEQQKIAEGQKQKVSSKNITNKHTQKNKSIFFKELNRITAIIFIVVSICLFIVIILHIVICAMVFILATLYFSASTVWNNLKMFLIDVLEPKEYKGITKVGDKYSKRVPPSFLIGILAIVSAIIIYRHKKRM